MYQSVSGRAERARGAFAGVPPRRTAALVEAKSASRVCYGENNTPHAAAAWRMAGACARQVLSRTPEMDEPHRHAFAPHVASGDAAQQPTQPVHGQHAQPVTRKHPYCRPHPLPGTPVITPMEALAARCAGSARRTSLPCAVTRLHTAARSEGEMPLPINMPRQALRPRRDNAHPLHDRAGCPLLARRRKAAGERCTSDTGCPSSRVPLCAALLGNLWTHQRTASRCN
jgi:hypothetical protein